MLVVLFDCKLLCKYIIEKSTKERDAFLSDIKLYNTRLQNHQYWVIKSCEIYTIFGIDKT